MSEKPTPGPWRIARNGANGATYRIWKEGKGERNEGYSCIATHVGGEANARLIASAPEMADRIAKLEAALAAAREECAKVAEAQVNIIGAGYGSSIWGALHGTAAAIRAMS